MNGGVREAWFIFGQKIMWLGGREDSKKLSVTMKRVDCCWSRIRRLPFDSSFVWGGRESELMRTVFMLRQFLWR